MSNYELCMSTLGGFSQSSKPCEQTKEGLNPTL